MIVPIHGLRYHKYTQPNLHDELLLVKEKENLFDAQAIAAYTLHGEKVGYISARSSQNVKVYSRMQQEIICAKIWALFPNQILVELDFPKNTPPKNCGCRNGIKVP